MGKSPSEITRNAIIAAAIASVARDGVAGASLRSINVAAGSKNSSAAHYHFGTKLALLEAACESIIADIRPGQDARLDALERRMAEGKSVTPREVLAGIYQPYLALLLKGEPGFAATKFASRLLVESDAEIQEIVNRIAAPYLFRALALLEYALPETSRKTIVLRLFITGTNVIHGAGDIRAAINSPAGDLTEGDLAGFIERLLDYIAAAVSAAEVVE